MNLKGRSFLTLKDFTPEEILYLLDLAADLKAKKKQGITGNSLKGKNIALIFEKPSTRTRCAFTVGAADEGGNPTYLAGNEIQLGHKESIEDTARVLGRMFDGIEFRGFDGRVSSYPDPGGSSHHAGAFRISEGTEVRLPGRWPQQYGQQPVDRLFQGGCGFCHRGAGGAVAYERADRAVSGICQRVRIFHYRD